MLFTQRRLWFAVRWIFPALVVVVLGAASAAPPQQSFTVAQLSIELGSKKSSKHKCPKSDPECQQGWNNERESEKHKEKSLKRQLLELGVGEAIDGAARSTKTKKKVKKGGASATTEKNKKGGNKIAKPGKKPGGDPKDKPVFVPPEFPALAMQDCEDCYELWDSILWYEFIISVDARKLFDRRRDLEDRRAEMEELRSRLGGAGSIDKVYYSQEIERHSEYIEAIEKLNAELEQLIAKEWAILRERMDQYVECAGHYCPILVKTEQVELVPAGPPATTEPPPADPAPSEPLASGTTYDWTTTTKLGLGYEPKYGGYTPTEPTTYGPTVPRLRPPEGDRKVCGPDVTPAVIKTLKKIREDFNASPEKQTAACRSLIDPRTGGVAWDIDKLSPAVAVPQVREKENPFSYEKEYDAWVQTTRRAASNPGSSPGSPAKATCAPFRAMILCARRPWSFSASASMRKW